MGKTQKLNLELNLGDSGKQGSLNKWIEVMLDNGHKVFLSGDAKFFDNLLGVGLDPTSEDAFTMYHYETKQGSSQVGCHSELKENTQNHFCHHFLPHITFQMAITAFVD